MKLLKTVMPEMSESSIEQPLNLISVLAAAISRSFMAFVALSFVETLRLLDASTHADQAEC